MAAANKNTVVVVQSVGPVVLESILALDGVKAVVWAGLGSQESGNALVDILYGSTNPSGKLPCKYYSHRLWSFVSRHDPGEHDIEDLVASDTVSFY